MNCLYEKSRQMFAELVNVTFRLSESWVCRELLLHLAKLDRRMVRWIVSHTVFVHRTKSLQRFASQKHSCASLTNRLTDHTAPKLTLFLPLTLRTVLSIPSVTNRQMDLS